MSIMHTDLYRFSAPANVRHLTLFADTSAAPVCGARRQGDELDVGYAALNDPVTRDGICRSCLREWLKNFRDAPAPPWADELKEVA